MLATAGVVVRTTGFPVQVPEAAVFDVPLVVAFTGRGSL